MSYVSADEVRDIVAKDVEQPAGTAAELGDARLQQAITSAQAEVDGKLGARYRVPFDDPAPQLVQDITGDIAAYLASLVVRQTKDFSSERDPIWLRYQRAQALLSQIADGTVDLPIDSTTPPTGGGGMRGINRYHGDLFTMRDFGLGPV